MEKFTVIASKIISLSSPQSIHLNCEDKRYFEKIIQHTKYFSMLFDYRFYEDCKLISLAESISKKAQSLYEISNKSPVKTTELILNKNAELVSEVEQFEKDTSIYLMTEWSRICVEACDRAVTDDEWHKIHEFHKKLMKNDPQTRESYLKKHKIPF